MDIFLEFLDKVEYVKPSLVKTFKSAYLESVYEPKPRNYGAGIFFLCTGTKRVLLLLRSPNEEDPSVWCGLGGKGEVNESPMQTAQREVWEEGQIAPDAYKLIPRPLRVNRNSPNFKFITYLGLTQNEFNPTINHEHTDAKWLNFDEMRKLPLHYGIEAIINDPKTMDDINNYLV